jgi:hypothetical protein
MPGMFELVTALGPLVVASAVFASNSRQTKWANAVARRAAAVEDQKFRLALLDRRASALEAIRVASSEFMTRGEATFEAVQRVQEALRVAELVYDQEDETAIRDALADLVRWQTYKRRADAYIEHDNGRYQPTLDQLFAVEDRLITALPELRSRLLAASRVTQVAPIKVPTSRWHLRRKPTI